MLFRSATATIVAAKHDDVLLVPNTALRFTPGTAAPAGGKPAGGVLQSLTPRMPSAGGSRRPAAAGAGSTANAREVWVLPDGQAAPVAVPVVPGLSDGQVTEIIGGGLRPGMRVVTAQQTRAAP